MDERGRGSGKKRAGGKGEQRRGKQLVRGKRGRGKGGMGNWG